MSISSNARLVPDMIPETSFFKNVRSLVSRSRWDELRKACYAAAGNCCEVCGGQYGLGRKHPVECHEVWQYEYATGVQRLVRLIALCPLCHMANHLGMANILGVVDQVHEHLAKVNGMDDSQADALVSAAWAEWHTRNQVQWVLDITALEPSEPDLLSGSGSPVPEAVTGDRQVPQIAPAGEQLVTPVGPVATVLYKKYSCFLPRDRHNKRRREFCLNFECAAGRTLDDWFEFTNRLRANFVRFVDCPRLEQLRIDPVFVRLPAHTHNAQGWLVSRYREGTVTFKLVDIFQLAIKQADHTLFATYLEDACAFLDMAPSAKRAALSHEMLDKAFTWGFLSVDNLAWDSENPRYVTE